MSWCRCWASTRPSQSHTQVRELQDQDQDQDQDHLLEPQCSQLRCRESSLISGSRHSTNAVSHHRMGIPSVLLTLTSTLIPHPMPSSLISYPPASSHALIPPLLPSSPALLSCLLIARAGGVRDMADMERVARLGKGRVDVSVGSALDVFGGSLPYADVVAWSRAQTA